ncbi:glycoside hydrolase family 3 N-terminal domain-containing protein [Corynebacterium lubricantis]|uniref:glycoside hydrolase family 3 N-terminal domain-containing protein n=1 Tax=Corynebacterium lubricantis TaxID=541095 RepID=UPI0003A69BF0|nr:glycoside hydrolase family 3 N-terminal domain-containing protein [Corynebacterium lubricantis]
MKRRGLTLALSLTLAGASALASCSTQGQDDGGASSLSNETSSSTPAEATPTSTSPASPTQSSTASPTQSAQDRVPEELRAKAASLMVVGVTDFDTALQALELGVGGIFVPSWADSSIFTEPGRDIAALRERIDRPFSVSIDFEGGRVQRHTNVFGEWPSPRVMTQGTPEEVRGMGYDMGTSLREHGVTVDFAPLLDVDVAGLDIVGDRAFGTDAQTVATYGAAFAQGLVDAGVTPTYKHFPGHGQASGDTHLGEAITPPLAELEQLDLVPYTMALTEVPEASVMVGHMVVPGLGDGQTPSTLNPAAYELLRSGKYPGGTPFDGLVVTDDMSGMRAISDRMGTAEAVTAAISAGADQVLWSTGDSIEASINQVVGAVEAGEIPQERIDEAALRVQQQYLHEGL